MWIPGVNSSNTAHVGKLKDNGLAPKHTILDLNTDPAYNLYPFSYSSTQPSIQSTDSVLTACQILF